MDIVLIVIVVVFFALSGGLVAFFGRL